MIRKLLALIGLIPAAGGVLVWPASYLFDLQTLQALDFFRGRGGVTPHVLAVFLGAISFLYFRRRYATMVSAKVVKMQRTLTGAALILILFGANLLLISLPEKWVWLSLPRFNATVVAYVLGYVLLGGGIAPGLERTNVVKGKRTRP